ncbi:MAG: PBSX family phage terminase large subunit, partial [Clostridiales bacterium]|nr:PBSX family phage terminase large subunit [Clostridiales bacterium]
MKIEKLSEKQFQIFAFAVSDVPFLICDGAVRSGKTVCMASAFVMWAMDQFDRHNFAICGKTVANAERNVLAPLLTVENLPYRMRYNRAERKMICRCGRRENYFYLFGGKDESSYTLIQGITLAGVLLDEVALMPRSFVDQALARTLTFYNAKIWFNCNPESQMHWFNQDWIIPTDAGERNAKHLHFLMSDNPTLGPAELKKAESMFTGVFYQRYILGLWAAAEGLVYDMFSEQRNVADALPELA